MAWCIPAHSMLRAASYQLAQHSSHWPQLSLLTRLHPQNPQPSCSGAASPSFQHLAPLVTSCCSCSQHQQGSSELAQQLETYMQQHTAVVTDIASVLTRLGLQPGLGCVIGDDLTTIDIGVLAGDPQRKLAFDVVPRPEDLEVQQQQQQAAAENAEGQQSGASSSSSSPQRQRPHAAAATPGARYAQAQVRRQLLSSHGWTWVQVPLVEWVGIMQEDHEQLMQQQQPRSAAGSAAAQQQQQSGHGGDGGIGSIRHRYLELAVQEAVEQQQQGHHHHHHHHGHGGDCGPGCGH